MSITVGSSVTQADIQALITSVNAEIIRRVSGETPISSGTVGETLSASATFSRLESVRRTLNTIHSKTRTSKVSGTPGGPPSGFDGTNRVSSVAIGSSISGSVISIISADIAKLVGQCDCNTYSGDTCCNAQTTCGTNCSCNQNCSCEFN